MASGRRRRSKSRKRRALPIIAVVLSVLAIVGVGVVFFSKRDYSTSVSDFSSSTKSESETYLGALPEKLSLRVLPPPQGDEADQIDRLAFENTRSLKGSARWTMASNDQKTSTKSLLRSFSCAAGVELDRDHLPILSSLLKAAGADAVRVASGAKRKYQRTRPYVNFDGATCDASAVLKEEGDYPSGHSARGWTVGLILAELIPERAESLRARSRQYAESRMICGFHSKSGIEGGRSVSELTFAALMANKKFQDDLRRAGQELAAYRRRAQPLPDEVCRWEEDVLGKSY